MGDFNAPVVNDTHVSYVRGDKRSGQFEVYLGRRDRSCKMP